MVIIFIILKILSKYKILCDCSYSNCISCNSQYSCLYNNGVCSTKQLIYNKDYLFFKLKQCLLDSYSKSIIDTYCGNLELKLNNKKLIIELPKINKTYGNEYLFCPFNIINSKGPSNKFYIEFKKLNLLDFPFDLYLEINSNNISYIMTPITDSKLLYEIKGTEKITINYFSKYSYKNKPFKIIVSFEKRFFEIKTMIIILILIIAIIIIFLCIIILIIYKRKEINRLILFNRDLNNQRRQEDLQIIEKNKKIAQEYANNIQPVIFKNIKNSAKNTSCNFCLNEFNLEDNVFIGNCFHVFHYEEIKKWIFSNDIFHNTCPECRREFIKFFQKEDLVQVNNQHNNYISNQENNNNQNYNPQNNNNLSQNNVSSNNNLIIQNQNNSPISSLNHNYNINQLQLRENQV